MPLVLSRPSQRLGLQHLSGREAGRQLRCPHDATLAASELRSPLLSGTLCPRLHRRPANPMLRESRLEVTREVRMTAH